MRVGICDRRWGYNGKGKRKRDVGMRNIFIFSKKLDNNESQIEKNAVIVLFPDNVSGNKAKQTMPELRCQTATSLGSAEALL